MKLARDVRVDFKDVVEAQGGQTANVAAAFRDANKIVRDVIKKTLVDMTTALDDLQKKTCTDLEKHVKDSQEKREYLYTCKSGISATLYIDVSLTL